MALLPSGVPSRTAIQEAIDETVADTGWVAMTSLLDGVAAHYRRRGKVVSVRVQGTTAAAAIASGTFVQITGNDLPVDMRPPVNLWGGALTGAYVGGIGVDASGSVFIRQDSGSAKGGDVAAVLTYIAA